MDLLNISDDELIRLRIQVGKELNRRGIKFNVGDLGEKLVINHFNTTPGLPTLRAAPPGTKNVDAISRDGHRYSIKTVLKAKKTGTIYPDSSGSNLPLFEYILVLELNQDFEIKRITRFSWTQFLEARSWDKRMNSWYVSLSKPKLKLGETVWG